MEHFLGLVFVGYTLFLFLNFPHQFLGLLVLIGHNVTHAEIGQNYGTNVQNLQWNIGCAGWLKY